MTSKIYGQRGFVWVYAPMPLEPVAAGKLEADDQGNVEFNYGKAI